MRWSAQVDPAVPDHAAVEGQAREACDKPREGDRGLQSGEGRAQAVMRPGAEGDVVARVVAAEPEFCGGGAPEKLIAVVRGEAGHNEGSGWEDGSPGRDRFEVDTPAVVHRVCV